VFFYLYHRRHHNSDNQGRMTSTGYFNPRKYNPSDKTEVISVFRHNTPQYFAPEEEKELIAYLDQFSQHYFILEWEGKIIGCGGINLSEDLTTARISWDFIHPDHQAKGLGSALLQFRIEKIKEFKTMRTITVRTSQMAYLFYEKAGFVLVETIKDYWAPGFDLYRMEYTIS
ncbi:MAG: GNAT family N-acetyltransferase, partial [Saprospiraceae bacterium]|nr:GNAT family N-acetyltransferase [Saprospiraceae bacterium]